MFVLFVYENFQNRAEGRRFVRLPGYTNIGMPNADTQKKIELCVRYLRLVLDDLDLAISGTGMQNSFSDATASRVETDIQRIKFYLEMGEILEAPCMRIFTGTAPVDIRRKGWKTIMDERIIPVIKEAALWRGE